MNTPSMRQAARPQTGRLPVPPGIAFATVVVLWLALGMALIADPMGLVDLWSAIEGAWLPVRAMVWLFFLPWVLALWAWQSDWTLWLRLAAMGGLALVTVTAFYPRRVGN